MNIKPAWLLEAEKYIGVKEIPGVKHEPKILAWWKAIKMGGVKDDETPYCAAFVGAMLEATGHVSTRSGWAKSYLNWGAELSKPVLGAVAVLDRKGGGGHVGFVVGLDSNNRIMLLGANQNNSVSIAPFELRRVLGWRYPLAAQVPAIALSRFNNNNQSSTNEA